MSEPIDNLKKSGHLLHLRVYNIVKKVFVPIADRQELLVAPYFSDGLSDKPREVDLVLKRQIGHKKFEKVFLRIFLECKYLLPGKEAVFLEEKNSGLDRHFRRRMLGLNNERISQNSRYQTFLREDKIAVLCEPFDNLFKGVDSLLKASQFDRQNNHSKIDYLVVVVGGQNNMFSWQYNKFKEIPDKQDLQTTDYELFLVNYFRENERILGSQPTLIEFVHENKLEEVLRDIIEEVRDFGFSL